MRVVDGGIEGFHSVSSRIMTAAARRTTMALSTALANMIFCADTEVTEDT